MAGRFMDLLGTVFAKFQLGIGGPQLKNISADIAARNAADSTYAAIRASLVKVFGNDIQLNAGAGETGADWIMTISRPGTGMTHDLQIIMPSGDPAPGQAITVFSFAGNVITLGYTTVAAGTDKIVVDTTDVAFGSTSPIAMYSNPAAAVILENSVIIDTPFNGAPQLSIGISGTASKYMAATANDLTAAAAVRFEVSPNLPAQGPEALIATYTAGGASVGAARILTAYVIPS